MHDYKKSNERRKNLKRFLSSSMPHKKRGVLRRFSDWIYDWHITRIMQSIGAFALILAIITFIYERIDSHEQRKVNELSRLHTLFEITSSMRLTDIILMDTIDFLNETEGKAVGIIVGDDSNEEKLTLNQVFILNKKLFGSKFSNIKFNMFIANRSRVNTDFFNSSFGDLAFKESTIKVDVKEAKANRVLFERSTGYFRMSYSHINILSISQYFSVKDYGGELKNPNMFISDSKIKKYFLSGSATLSITDSVVSEWKLKDFYCEWCSFERVDLSSMDFELIQLSPRQRHRFIDVGDVSCKQFTSMKGWENTIRDERLSCGMPLLTQ